ncbi:MAG: DUF2807 domain-containing protein, partial [Pseudomonadota bacterium]
VMGETASVIASADHGDFSKLLVKVEDGVLIVRRSDTFGNNDGLYYKATVTATSLDLVKASTGATLNGRDLAIEDGKLIGDTGAIINVAGTCGSLFVKSATGAEIDASDLKCRSVKVKGRIGGIAKVYASDRIEAFARMGAEITVHGDPKSRDRGRFLGGEVRYVE